MQGYCVKANAFRTFRKDRVLENIDESSDVEERLQFHIENSSLTQKSQAIRAATRRSNTSAPEIYFTGFKKADKIKLVELAESEGMVVRGAVTINLEFLCCGYNAGPKKIEKARHHGVIILSESQFKTMLQTGEIPEGA
ncbi:BRCT domain-containing protein [Candidatus Electrothrix gigas]